MMSLRCYGNSDCTAPKTLAIPIIEECGHQSLYYVLVRCDLYFKLKGVTVEKSDRNSSLRGLCHSCGTTNIDKLISTLVSRLPGGSLL